MPFPRGSMLWRLGEATDFTLYSEIDAPLPASSRDAQRQSKGEPTSQLEQMHMQHQQQSFEHQVQQQHAGASPEKPLSKELHRPNGVALAPDAWGRGYWE